jgi:hypothetical protein
VEKKRREIRKQYVINFVNSIKNPKLQCFNVQNYKKEVKLGTLFDKKGSS